MLLSCQRTPRFCTLQIEATKQSKGDENKFIVRTTSPDAPIVNSVLHRFQQPTTSLSNVVLPLADLLGHIRRETTSTLRSRLLTALTTEGFCLLTVPRRNRPGRVIQELYDSLHHEMFPETVCEQKLLNVAGLCTSRVVYVSERGVPMYRLGYEACPDGVREVFRWAGRQPDDCPWPSPATRQTWCRGLGLCRFITDIALDMLMGTSATHNDCTGQNADHLDDTSFCHSSDVKSAVVTTDSTSTKRCRRHRPHSGSSSWAGPRLSDEDYRQNVVWKDRAGDFSVMYAMHYFNDPSSIPISSTQQGLMPDHSYNCSLGEPLTHVAVKQHVDPSLLVLEPFLCSYTSGLQVWDRQGKDWIDCDGPTSPFASLIGRSDEFVMVMFAGKALSEAIPAISPTLHRVVHGHQARRTIIYEQKYEEFFPAPLLD